MRKYEFIYNDDTYSYYINNILKDGSLLNYKSEQKLAKKLKAGDRLARKKMIESNLKLVIKIAMHYLLPGINIMDLIQEGNIGLIIAVDKFDYKKRIRFSTYASNWIKQKIFRYIVRNKRSIKLSLKKGELLLRIERELSKLSGELHRTPTIDEIASATGTSNQVVKGLLNCLPVAIPVEEIAKSNTESQLLPIYLLDEYHPEKIAFKNLLREKTMEILNTLVEREAQIIKYRFGLYDGKQYSLKETGEMVGLSTEAIRQIEVKILKKLRVRFTYLKEFLSI